MISRCRLGSREALVGLYLAGSLDLPSRGGRGMLRDYK
jgi:hypothetical protein